MILLSYFQINMLMQSICHELIILFLHPYVRCLTDTATKAKYSHQSGENFMDIVKVFSYLF